MLRRPDAKDADVLVREDLGGLLLLVQLRVALAGVELQEDVGLDGAHLGLARAEEQLLLAALLSLLLDHLLRAELGLPALVLEELDERDARVHEVPGVPPVPPAQDVALPELPGPLAAPLVLEEAVELPMHLAALAAIDLHLAAAVEDHKEVGRVAQGVLVAAEDELLLAELPALAVVAGGGGDEAPAGELHHGVADGGD
mmetsp:Transcript_26959/g.83895  ORF Transcript_26959/g.83895 Transcript_26959/m.83895 type:complete len:200 (+) Transcript_26959:1609-2208(+)